MLYICSKLVQNTISRLKQSLIIDNRIRFKLRKTMNHRTLEKLVESDAMKNDVVLKIVKIDAVDMNMNKGYDDDKFLKKTEIYMSIIYANGYIIPRASVIVINKQQMIKYTEIEIERNRNATLNGMYSKMLESYAVAYSRRTYLRSIKIFEKLRDTK